MKKILLAVFLLTLAFESRASHATGGEITYEYIGDSTGIPFHYEVTLSLYRKNTSGSAGLGNTMSLNISSSCSGNMNVTVSRISAPPGLGAGDGGMIIFPRIDCTNPQDPNLVPVSKHVYKAVVTLPGKCADFTFSYSLCCRNNVISNIVNSSGTSIYLEAKLNNTLRPNSTPTFPYTALRSTCVGRQVESHFGGYEPDGDSVYYSLITPFDNANTTVQYSQGYSSQQPISTTTGVSFNSSTGFTSFTPSQIENVILMLQSSEYHYDTTFNRWLLIGSTYREIMLNIVGSCSQDSTTWVSEFNDSISANSLSCGDSLIQLNTLELFSGNSLAADGSDFALLNSHNQLIPIIKAEADFKNAQQQMASSLFLHLNKPIAYNDTLTLITRLGNDLNTLVNACGEELKAGDSISFIVSSCATSIALEESPEQPGVHFYPNPVSSSMHIELPEARYPVNIQVYDLKGRNILSQEFFTNQFDLQLDFLPKGVYILKVTADQWAQVSKFEKL